MFVICWPSEKTGAKISVACPKRLRKFLKNLHGTEGYIVAKNGIDGYAKRTIQDRIAKIRKSIGADEYQIHGWRYNASIELAEAGNSDSHIQSVTGHKSTEMVKKYRKMANQKVQSKNAQRKRDKMITKQKKKNKSRTKRETAKPQENQNKDK